MAKSIEYNATLTERIDVTDALTIFRFKPDTALPAQKWFVPGQYVVIGLNNEAQPELGAVQRPMSISSAPQVNDHIEFYIRYVNQPSSKNPLTHLLWKLRAGGRAFVRTTAKGKFTVKDLIGDADPRLKVFVAAGTGLAPFLAIVRSHLHDHPGASLAQFAIIHGASFPADLGFRAELDALASRHGLHYIPTVSRYRESPDWRGARGRAEDCFTPERLADTESRLGLKPGELRPAHAAIFICGLQGTIGSTIERLVARGFVPDDRGLRKAFAVPEALPAALFYEQYDSDPVVDLTNAARVAELASQLKSALAAPRA